MTARCGIIRLKPVDRYEEMRARDAGVTYACRLLRSKKMQGGGFQLIALSLFETC